MNSLERAKALLARTGKQVSLTILPLAAVAVSAHASSISLPGTVQLCNESVTGDVQAVGNGVQFSFGPTNCGSGGANLYASGSATGMTTGNTFPVSWDFDVTGGNSYEVAIYMPISGGNEVFLASGGITSESQEITGSGTATVGPAGGASYEVYFDVGLNGSGGSVTLNSLDLNVSSAPEPASLFLVVPGMGLLLLKRRKSAPRT